MQRKIALLVLAAAAVAAAYFIPGCDTLTTETNEIVIAGNPQAEFTAGPKEVGCESLTVEFTDASVGPHNKWIWDFGDGATDSVQNPVHTFGAGMFNVSLTIIDTEFTGDNPAFQGRDTETKKRFIVVGTVVDGFNPSDTVGCIGDTIIFAPTDFRAIDSLRWNFGDGTPNSRDTVASHVYSDTGRYDVTLTAFGDCGTKSITDSGLIHIVPCPVVRMVASDSSGCVPLSVTFYDDSYVMPSDTSDTATNDVFITSWNWDFGNGVTANNNVATVEFDNGGIYDIILTVRANNGQSATDTFPALITAYDTSYATFTALTSPERCYNPYQQFQVMFAATQPGSFDSLVWHFDGAVDTTIFTDTGALDTAITPVIAFVNPGKYSVTLQTYSPCGGDEQTIDDFVTLAEPLTPADIAYSVSPDTTGDTSQVFTFTDLSTGIISDRTWDFSGGNTSTEQPATYQFSAAGTYSVTLTIANACNQVDTTFHIVVTAATGK